jgi:Zn-dependent membrane protease YugP
MQLVVAVLLLPPFIIWIGGSLYGVLVQWLWSAPKARNGLDSVGVAQRLLSHAGLEIAVTTDEPLKLLHFDARNRRLRLSQRATDKSHLAAMGVAAYGVGIVQQMMEQKSHARWRTILDTWLIRLWVGTMALALTGILLRLTPLMAIGLAGVFVLLYLTSSILYPAWDASQRGYALLESARLLDVGERTSMRHILRALAFHNTFPISGWL